MVSEATTLDAAAVLAGTRASRKAAEQAEVLAGAVAWAHLHVVDDIEGAATWQAVGFGDTGISLGGPGVPLVAEFCVAELAAALNVSTDAGRNLISDGHRLPRVLARVAGPTPWPNPAPSGGEARMATATSATTMAPRP